MDILAPLVVGLVGVVVGGLLTRSNEKKAQGERLLVEALNDAATAIAEVASGEGRHAQNRYASAVSRIALHGSPAVIAKFRTFQVDATTSTVDGRQRLLDAVLEARRELGHGAASSEDIAVLLFGSLEPSLQICARCGTKLALGQSECASCGGSADSHYIDPESSK